MLSFDVGTGLDRYQRQHRYQNPPLDPRFEYMFHFLVADTTNGFVKYIATSETVTRESRAVSSAAD